MKQKVVLITGGAKGIGAAIAKKFASFGYNIVINYLTSEKVAQELKQKLEKLYSCKVLCIKADITKEEEIKSMLSEVIHVFSHIDVLINNAAINPGNLFSEKSSIEFNQVVHTILTGTFLMCKFVGEYMLEQQTGEIINISSTNGIDAIDLYSMDYDASKAGVISLTHHFAHALAPYIRVNALAPGWTNTESVMEMNPTYLEEEKKKILLKRFAEPEEIANVAFFLASEEAKYINSSIIRVDGGKK